MNEEDTNQANPMDIPLKRVTPQKEPQSGPLGGVQEAIVIIVDDSSMGAISPRDLPLGQDV